MPDAKEVARQCFDAAERIYLAEFKAQGVPATGPRFWDCVVRRANVLIEEHYRVAAELRESLEAQDAMAAGREAFERGDFVRVPGPDRMRRAEGV